MKKTLIALLLMTTTFFAVSNQPFTQCVNGVCTTYYPAVIEHQRLLVEQERLRLEREKYYQDNPEARPLTRADRKRIAEEEKIAKKEAYKRKLAEANRKAREHNARTAAARYNW